MDRKLSLQKVKEAQKQLDKIRKEVGKVVVGQENVINGLLRALLANGHVLVEGIPGIAKTLIIRALAMTIGCDFKRIQFTVDLLPADILGITAYDQKKGFSVVKGPIFANFVLADEINRSNPKTQSSLLEAMQEKQVTIGKQTFPMNLPFFVMATQNPIEQAGVYPLPEAQVDRFLFWLRVYYPTTQEEQLILNTNITLRSLYDYKLKSVMRPGHILKLQQQVHDIYLSKSIEKYIIQIVNATRYPQKYGITLGKYVQWGGSPRASIGLFIASKADALLNGKNFVTPQNVKDIAHDVLRHRILLNYEGEAENITTDAIITEILSKTPVP